ncbi:hypothetical protein [Rhizobium glycinendophyticum]|uniref:Uncharacterized protein n=1 Tax=Rhizobium glycinendophyticum TaxID=2589807 RepID=A0A504U1E1_9HYPH|nr:hypothetical protein [Rhizobium glycinendophyticum]TPP03696.1 hypothetical protein FJQ55_23210 [Rhizobium glycinendophyticum]
MASPVILIAGIFGLALGAYGFTQELPVLSYGDGASIGATEALRDGDLKPTSSYYGHKRLMLACMQGMTGLWYSVADDAQRQMLAKNCLDLALQYTAKTPVDSFGWVLAARASFILHNVDGMNRYLAYSKAAGPNEQWIAAHRVELFETARTNLSEINKTNAERDLELMVTSLTGIRSVAQRYLSDADFRERITDIVETLPERDQRRFITNVRRAASN